MILFALASQRLNAARATTANTRDWYEVETITRYTLLLESGLRIHASVYRESTRMTFMHGSSPVPHAYARVYAADLVKLHTLTFANHDIIDIRDAEKSEGTYTCVRFARNTEKR